MTVYATPTQLRVLLTRDVDAPAGTPAELSDVALQSAIDTAQAYIDANLAHRYQVPFPPPPPALIVQLTLAIAAYHADTTHRQSIDIDNNDPVLRRHNWAVVVLGDLGRGALDLPDTQPSSSHPDGATPRNAYTGVLFTDRDFGLAERSGSGPDRGPIDDGKW